MDFQYGIWFLETTHGVWSPPDHNGRWIWMQIMQFMTGPGLLLLPRTHSGYGQLRTIPLKYPLSRGPALGWREHVQPAKNIQTLVRTHSFLWISDTARLGNRWLPTRFPSTGNSAVYLGHCQAMTGGTMGFGIRAMDKVHDTPRTDPGNRGAEARLPQGPIPLLLRTGFSWEWRSHHYISAQGVPKFPSWAGSCLQRHSPEHVVGYHHDDFNWSSPCYLG
jgi:hypothetical protein